MRFEQLDNIEKARIQRVFDSAKRDLNGTLFRVQDSCVERNDVFYNWFLTNEAGTVRVSSGHVCFVQKARLPKWLAYTTYLEVDGEAVMKNLIKHAMFARGPVDGLVEHYRGSLGNDKPAA